ncbi:MAG: hypothetical protein H7Z17_01940 [Fuerstia sp.]|nr:hypothetical protein [Fuerstiella sp.]
MFIRNSETLEKVVRRSVATGKVIGRRGAEEARRMAGLVASEAVRQAEIAKPMVTRLLRRGYQASQRQLQLANPVVRKGAAHSMMLVTAFLNRMGVLLHRISKKCWTHVLSYVCQWSPVCFHSGGIRTALVSGCLSLMTLTGLGITGFSPGTSQKAASGMVGDVLGKAEDVIQSTAGLMAVNDGSAEFEGGNTESSNSELEQQILQAQAELEQAAADYDYAIQLWNAEVAACQSGSSPGYTARQLGVFSAMGVNTGVQPQRQPNPALSQSLSQAEQRFLVARDICQQLAAAQ